MPSRDLQPMAETLFSRFVGELCEKLDDRTLDQRDVCRDAAAELYVLRRDLSRLDDESVPLGTRAPWGNPVRPLGPKDPPCPYCEEAAGASRTSRRQETRSTGVHPRSEARFT